MCWGPPSHRLRNVLADLGGSRRIKYLLTPGGIVRSLPPPRVLVVDDEPAVCHILVRALEEAGYEVVAVRDGKAGASAVETAGVPFDLVVTNSCMPTMNGEELIGHLRGLFPNLPILHLDDLSHPIGPNAEMVPTLYKPFTIRALLESVARAVAERALR
jgi:two-component system, cell cycle response regulator CpdR